MNYKFNLWRKKATHIVNNRSMTDEDYEKLDELLGKLTYEFGDNRILLCPFYMMDAPNIGVYNAMGERIWCDTRTTIKSLVEKYKSI